jgi:hypothetical protein
MKGIFQIACVTYLFGYGFVSGELESLADLKYTAHSGQEDSHSFLASNYLLYSSSCRAEVIYALGISELRPRVATSLSLMKQLDSSADRCSLVCLQQGIPRILVQHTLPFLITQNVNFDSGVLEWVQSECDGAELGIVNNMEVDIDVFWVDAVKGRVHTTTIAPGGENTMYWTETFLGHTFEVQLAGSSEVIKVIHVEHDSFVPIGDSPRSRGHPGFLDHLERHVSDLFQEEWAHMHLVNRTFTSIGFGKGRLPNDLWASLSAFYNNNRKNKVTHMYSHMALQEKFNV